MSSEYTNPNDTRRIELLKKVLSESKELLEELDLNSVIDVDGLSCYDSLKQKVDDFEEFEAQLAQLAADRQMKLF